MVSSKWFLFCHNFKSICVLSSFFADPFLCIWLLEFQWELGFLAWSKSLKLKSLTWVTKLYNATIFFVVVAHFLLKTGDLETHQKQSQHWHHPIYLNGLHNQNWNYNCDHEVVESLINISWNDGDLKVGEAKYVNRNKGMLQVPNNKVEIDSKDDIENTSPKARKKYYKWKWHQ